MEIKQCILEQPMSQRRKQKESFKSIETNENGNATFQNLWRLWKQF